MISTGPYMLSVCTCYPVSIPWVASGTTITADNPYSRATSHRGIAAFVHCDSSEWQMK